MTKRTEAFTPLAEDYARYRPGYPSEVLDVLKNACDLTRNSLIADIGSGTGNLARLFLAAGHQVVGVEPNHEMRNAAERLLSEYAAFRSLDGSAERIPLEKESVDLIAVGQALHWFDIDRARAEFGRILRPGGWVAVLWNDRLSDATPFTREYDAVTNALAAEKPPLCTVSFSANLDSLFGAATIQSAAFPHTQRLDLQGILGRARSSGYIAQPGCPGHEEQTKLMTDLFHRHQRAGVVEFHYLTQLHFARLDTNDSQ